MNNKKMKELVTMIVKQSEDMKQQVELTSKQSLAVYEMYKEVEETKEEMRSFRTKMNDFGNEMSEFKEAMERVEHKLDNRLTLDEAQMSEMTGAVREKAIQLADYLNNIGYYKNKSDFGQIVGAVMMGIRAMMKAKFGVNRWFKIREKDFDVAMDYVNGLGVNDFLKYRNRKVNQSHINQYLNKAQ